MAKLVVGLFSAATLAVLATKFPERFGWLRHTIELLFGQ